MEAQKIILRELETRVRRLGRGGREDVPGPAEHPPQHAPEPVGATIVAKLMPTITKAARPAGQVADELEEPEAGAGHRQRRDQPRSRPRPGS